MKRFLSIVFVFVCACGGWAVFALWELPTAEDIKNFRPGLTTEVVDEQGNVLVQLFNTKNRLWVPYPEVSPSLIDAVVASEDDTFFEHKGLNLREMVNALLDDLKRWRFARGASTITQQLARNAFLTREKSLVRKTKEIILAMKMEKTLPKQRILELYLNEAEWGDSLYGAEAASRYYFDKHASDLTLAESAALAAMLPNPHYYNPFRRMDKVVQRQREILSRMFQYHIIDESRLAAALGQPLTLRPPDTGGLAVRTSSDNARKRCWEEVLEAYLAAKYGRDRLLSGGLRITVPLNTALQRALETVVPDQNSPSGLILLVAEGDIPRGFSCVENKKEADAAALALFRKDHLVTGLSFHLVDREWFLTKARLTAD